MQELVPCVLVTFDKEQIVVWRGHDYKPPENVGHYLTHRELFGISDDEPVSGVEGPDSSD